LLEPLTILLITMGLHVLPEVITAIEILITTRITAMVGPFPRMQSQVTLQVFLAGQFQGAFGAGENPG
jgi:hypothetical protein